MPAEPLWGTGIGWVRTPCRTMRNEPGGGRGVTAPASGLVTGGEIAMGDGYQALRNSAALLDLSGRGKIRVTGEDRVRLLHAMVTNHVEQLGSGEGCYAFFLDAQGHILADVSLFRLEDSLLLDTEPETREKVFRHLDKYIIADDVTLEDVTDRMATLAVEGPGSGLALSALGTSLPATDHGIAQWGDNLVARVSATGASGYRIFVPVPGKAGLIERLTGEGVVTASGEEARVHRLENGVPRYGEDFGEDCLPHETQRLDAVHFNKGCYLGQEVVERVRSRGHVNRLLVRLSVASEQVPPPGAVLRVGGEDAGKITSAAFSPVLGTVVALGYVRTPYAGQGTALSVDGAAATVMETRPT